MKFNYKLAGGVAAATAATGAAAGIAAALALRSAYNWWRVEEVSGEVALITGGSRGLGLALSEELARKGCLLAICARDEQELDLARRRLQALGTSVLPVVCDVADQAQVERMIEQVRARFGRIDILINNAGIITVGPIESQKVEDFERAMDTMFWGTVYPTVTLLPEMTARRSGRIVNITSIGGRLSVPHLLPYNCAKFAAVGFSEGLRAELRRHNIRVTTVLPGLMRTGSYIQAEMKGNVQAEYTWFGLSSAMPLVAMNAQRAARRIVTALRRGEADVVLTPQAKLAALAHGIAPGLTADVLGLVNYGLPRPQGSADSRRKGAEVESPIVNSPLTAFGKRAVQQYQHRSAPEAATQG